jgi:DNA-directed RNA polymerase subunit omega
MRNDYVILASAVIPDPYILVNVVSCRVKQLRRGHRPLIDSLEKLAFEDIALREIAERKITFELASAAELEAASPSRPSLGRSLITPHLAPRPPAARSNVATLA